MKKPFLSTNLAFSAFTTKFVVVHDSSNSSKIKYLLYIFFWKQEMNLLLSFSMVLDYQTVFLKIIMQHIT